MIKINNWNEIYETHETRKLKQLRWVPIQNKHDGSGYRRIAAHKRNCEIFTAWILMLELASKNKERGILPQSPEDMAFKTGYPKEIFELAISVLSQPDIDWIKNSDIALKSTTSGDSPAIRQNTSPELNRIEENRREKKKDRAVPAHPLFSQIIKRFGEGYEAVKKVKYMDFRKDVKTLKQFLLDFPDMTIERFFDNVVFCASDKFHTHNLSIRYVCNNFSLLEAKRLNTEQSND